MHQGFKPVYDENSQVLILGSFPSVKSREQGFYYGNKQNRFWKMLSSVFDEEIQDNIEAKKSFLLKHHIALYDVIEQSDLKGSADIALEKSNNKTAEISFLLPPHTKVRKILCNGKTSFNILTSNGTNCTVNNIPIVYMPSTSPANPRYDFAVWQKELKK